MGHTAAGRPFLVTMIPIVRVLDPIAENLDFTFANGHVSDMTLLVIDRAAHIKQSSAVGIGCYSADVSVRKISVALETSTADAAAETAARHGVSLSSWLNQAAVRALRVEAGLLAVQAWETEHGPLTANELGAADRFLAKKQRKRAS